MQMKSGPAVRLNVTPGEDVSLIASTVALEAVLCRATSAAPASRFAQIGAREK
jgi:hypothetical protein